MNDTEFHQEQVAQFAAFTDALRSKADAGETPTMEALVEQFTSLAQCPDSLLDEGPGLVARLFTTAPNLAETFPRDLLWYLGADCLHFMPDSEIDRYAELDEQRREAAERDERFPWRQARAAALGLQ